MRHARSGLILAGIGALGLAAWAPGCLFAPDDCSDLLKCPGVGAGGSATATTGSMGGAGGGSAPTSTTSTGTSAGGCTVDADCKDIKPPTVCGVPWCINGSCGYKQIQESGSTKSQVYGDCHEVRCFNGLVVNEVNDNDVYDDANACTEDLCAKGVPSNKPLAAGDVCAVGTTVCDGQGACVACVTNTDCTTPTDCRNNYCVPATCYDTFLTPSPTGSETDVDCGGSACAPCGDGKKCGGETDCVSGVCLKPVGQSQLRCAPASCMDKVKNGKETAKDCGGPDCDDRCTTGDGCTVPADCLSHVCMSGKCLAPSCSDGVRNGNELGVDCGNSCPACLGG